MFRAKWTDAIHDEWIESVLETRQDITRVQLDRTKALMNQAVMDCLVEGYEGLMAGLQLPDTGDRHVLAAAIKANCRAIVTFNLKDFPTDILADYSVEAWHPDEFLQNLLGASRATVIIAARRCRARLKNPPMTAEEYLTNLDAQSLPRTAAELKKYAPLL